MKNPTYKLTQDSGAVLPESVKNSNLKFHESQVMTAYFHS